MNHLFWPTALIAALLFWIGCLMEGRLQNTPSRIIWIVILLALALPGLLFAAYYTKLLGEPIWLYWFRALPATELTAAGAGLLAGFAHQARYKQPFLKRQLTKLTIPVICALVIAVPYVKPVFRPLDSNQLQDHWEENVCLQSSASTCGPASAATIARSLGRRLTEAELARESLSYAGGTENWYLTRSLRKRGFKVEFVKVPPDSDAFPTPAIAGVKLSQGTGHFIALLDRQGATYSVGDPLIGKLTASLSELRTDYKFTGFFLVIK